MNTLQADIQQYTLSLLLYCIQASVSVIMDTLASSEATLNTPQAGPGPPKRWTDQEITDLIDYLFEHRSEGSGGNFKAATFNNLGRYMAERHPGQNRSREAIQTKFRSLKDIIVTIDGFNSKSGMGGGDPGRICIESETEQVVFNDYANAAKKETRRILETCLTQPFCHYEKLSIIMDNSRATGCFTHRGTMRLSDIENESDHSASTDNLGNKPTLLMELPSESLSLSCHRSTSSSGPAPTSLATPHSISETPHLPLLHKPSSSAYPPLSSSPSTFARSFFATPQVYVPPAPDSRLFQRDGQIRRSVSNPTTTSVPLFEPIHLLETQEDRSIHQSAFNPIPLTSLTPSATRLLTSENQASNPIQQAAPTYQLASQALTTSSIGSSLGKRKCVDAAPESGSSKRTSLSKDTPGISSALVGVTGAMITLSTSIITTYLKPQEKTKLYRYFCKESQDASALSDMDDDFR